MATFNFNVGTRTRFSNPDVDNEVRLTTAAQAVSGPWRVECDVRIDVYTPNGALSNGGRQAMCYIDARPSGDTAGAFGTGLVNDTNPNQGRRNVRIPLVAEFDYPEPQTFWFMVGLERDGSWVELISIAGVATSL
jgi:hypothetical protein